MSKVLNTGSFLKEYAKHVACVYAGTVTIFYIQHGTPTGRDLLAMSCLAAGFPVLAPMIGAVEVYNYLNPEDKYIYTLKYTNKKD